MDLNTRPNGKHTIVLNSCSTCSIPVEGFILWYSFRVSDSPKDIYIYRMILPNPGIS